ncbi:MAG TPA: hypothetical protein VFR67_20705 [Pilimelia sp.]|nr:hypothetical protein [Pilimelia sp.]
MLATARRALAAGVVAGAVAAAEANEAHFTERTGATCTDTATEVESRRAGNVFIAVARATASCTVPIPTTP